MAFMIVMATTFNVGDRAEVQINGAPATLFWRDDATLVINETDARTIVEIDTGHDGLGRPSRCFLCSDADAAPLTRIVACSWCHEVVALQATRYCPTCGHRADVARAVCDCPKCWKPDDEVAS
jgi:hypothetical protein